MKIFKYWSKTEASAQIKGQEWNLISFGNSNESEAAALEDAKAKLTRKINKLVSNEPFDSYEYSDRPLREEVKEEIVDSSGALQGVITRNGYGSYVLNCAHVMFIDIDFKPVGCLASILRKAPDSPEEDIFHNIKEVLMNDHSIGVRCYRTNNGMRLIVTSKLYDPKSDESQKLLEIFQSDPLYIKLCRIQECYRARLSAKPWRIDIEKPKFRFPWVNPSYKEQYRQWEKEYDAKALSLPVCSYMGHLGSDEIISEVDHIIKIHDHWCIKEGDLV